VQEKKHLNKLEHQVTQSVRIRLPLQTTCITTFGPCTVFTQFVKSTNFSKNVTFSAHHGQVTEHFQNNQTLSRYMWRNLSCTGPWANCPACCFLSLALMTA